MEMASNLVLCAEVFARKFGICNLTLRNEYLKHRRFSGKTNRFVSNRTLRHFKKTKFECKRLRRFGETNVLYERPTIKCGSGKSFLLAILGNVNMKFAVVADCDYAL